MAELHESLREAVKQIEAIRIAAQQVRTRERKQRIEYFLSNVQHHFEQFPHLPYHLTRAEQDHLDAMDMRLLTAALKADGHFEFHDTIILPIHVDK